MTDDHKPKALEVVPETKSLVHPLAQAMLSSGAEITPDSIKQMLELQQQWEANEAHKLYTRALVELKKELPAVVAHNKKGHTNTYTDLAALVDAVTPHLARFGFSISWRTETEGEKVRVTCVLTHSGGHTEDTSTMIAGPDSKGAKSGPQQIASTVTYLQRYTLRSSLGLATGDLPDVDNSRRGSGTDENLKLVARLNVSEIPVSEAEALVCKQSSKWGPDDRKAITAWAKDLANKRRSEDADAS